MSRAGLGKKMTLMDKWLKKPVFCRVLEELDDFDSFCELYISAASGLRVQPGGDGGGSDEHAVGSGGSAVNSPLRLAFQEFDADGDGALSLDGAHCVAASRRPHESARAVKSMLLPPLTRSLLLLSHGWRRRAARCPGGRGRCCPWLSSAWGRGCALPLSRAVYL